jgi:glycosyltransferase involved in cell wall biosynthesis
VGTKRKITIVTPVYNAVNDIEACILSVAAQSYTDIEHLIVDGASIDGTLEIVKRYAGKYSHIKLISEQDDGIYDAMNKGIDQASGEWIYFLGCDDVFYDEKVLEDVFSQDAVDSYDLVYGNVLWGDTGEIYDGKFSLLKLMEKNLCHQSVFYRNTLFEKLGKFDTGYKSWADYIFNIKCFNRNEVRLKYVDKVIAKYGINGFSSITPDQLFLEKREAIYQKYFPEGYVECWKKVQALSAELEEKRGEIAGFHLQLSESNRLTNEQNQRLQSQQGILTEKNEQIHALLNSYSWKISFPLRKIGDRLNKSAFVRNVITSKILTLSRFEKLTYVFSGKIRRLLGFKVEGRDSRHLSNCNLVLTKNYSSEDSISITDKTVSVIIPTKNAGSEFSRSLKMISAQKGFQYIEIVVVDSGSNDETISLAKAHGAKILTIEPHEFTHSFSRNLGADAASGDYLFFTVQDALIPTDYFLYEMFMVCISNKVAAVSCAEFPRLDSDLFYRVCCRNHYRFLEVSDSDRIFMAPSEKNYITLRKNGQLSDIGCFIARDLFQFYKYRFDYAEDLDLGIRLIEDEHRIAFLSSIKMIHSHNRPAFYYLKRGYVDQIYLTRSFPDYPRANVNIATLIDDISSVYICLSKFINERAAILSLPYHTSEFTVEMKSYFKKVKTQKNTESYKYVKFTCDDDQFNDFVKSLNKICMVDEAYSFNVNGEIFTGFMSMFDMMIDHLFATNDVVDGEMHMEIVACLYKQFALICGINIANAYICEPFETKALLDNIGLNISDGI